MSYCKRTTFLLFISLWVAELNGQTGPILPIDDPSLWNLSALYARGYLSNLDAGILPVYESDLLDGLSDIDGQDVFSSELAKNMRLRMFQKENLGSGRLGIRIRPGVLLSSQESANFLQRENDHQSVTYTLINFESWFAIGKWTAAWGWRQDRYYDRDPESIDTAHRWLVRPENAYLTYSGTYASFFLGRIRRHWAGYSQPGLLLSDNPRPMDHISFRLGTDRLNIRTAVFELDSITGDGRFTALAGDDSVSSGSERRYLAVHKLTLAKPGSWSLGLLHSVLYSGPNSNLSLKFINPLQLSIHSVDEKPKNDENNGFVGAFFEIRRPDIFIQGQFVVDDMDFLDRNEPASLAASIQLYKSALTTNLDVQAGATLVSARTYNSEQVEGKYLYLGRGIATQYSDFVSAYIAANWFSSPSLVIAPRVEILFQGSADIKQEFPTHDDIDAILTGVVERTVRGSIQIRGSFQGHFDVLADLGANMVSNSGHEDGRDSSYFSGKLGVGYRFMWQRAF